MSDTVFPAVLHLHLINIYVLIYISEHGVIFLKLVSSLKGVLFLPCRHGDVNALCFAMALSKELRQEHACQSYHGHIPTP